MSYFSGPTTPQMRLTVFLLGAALAGFGWFVGHQEIHVASLTPDGRTVYPTCNSPFDPRPIEGFLPALDQACSSALLPGRTLAVTCIVLGAILLIRLLYMLIGPKVPGPGAQPHTERHG